MRKESNWEWTIHRNSDGDYSYPAAQLAVLMDIRDELKNSRDQLIKLNQLLHCPSFVEIPRILRALRRNTTKRRIKKK